MNVDLHDARAGNKIVSAAGDREVQHLVPVVVDKVNVTAVIGARKTIYKVVRIAHNIDKHAIRRLLLEILQLIIRAVAAKYEEVSHSVRIEVGGIAGRIQQRRQWPIPRKRHRIIDVVETQRCILAKVVEHI